MTGHDSGTDHDVHLSCTSRETEGIRLRLCGSFRIEYDQKRVVNSRGTRLDGLADAEVDVPGRDVKMDNFRMTIGFEIDSQWRRIFWTNVYKDGGTFRVL